MASNPIADLSYRNYDGALLPPTNRWWVIAKHMMLIAFKKRSFWWVTAFSGWYYYAMIFILFIVDKFGQNAPPGAPNPRAAFMKNIVWKDQFLHGFSYGQILFLFIAIILGAGAIANDARANALLVYLSKPCTKRDYLMGKWVGVFLPLFFVGLAPAALFYLYGLMSFQADGFFSQDPWLGPQIVAAFAVGAAFQASLIVGISSMFKQGRMAGATYAGLYFISTFFTFLMAIAYVMMTSGGGPRHRTQEAPAAAVNTVANLFYGSVDGLSIGATKAIFGTNGTPPFGISAPGRPVPAPPLIPILLIMIGISAICMLIAWRRIRPVEVVG